MNVEFTLKIPVPQFSKHDNPDEVAARLKSYIVKWLRFAEVFEMVGPVQVSYAVKPAKHPPPGEAQGAHT